jgi:hypothetical protein
MIRQFSINRRLLSREGSAVVKPLDVTMIIPEQILGYLKIIGSEGYLDNVIVPSLKEGRFLQRNFFERPSYESKEVTNLELVAYKVGKPNSGVEIEPKYKPEWVENPPKSGFGWSNELSRSELGLSLDLNFVMNAFYYSY